MNHDEVVKNEIIRYMELQRIKADNGGHENKTLESALKESRATLQLLGANTENFDLL